MSYIEKFWRPATAADVARVMAGETVEARFADDGDNWVFSKLRGWRSSSRVLVIDNWLDDDGARWDCCQVYDPPQWYLDKPEPGEGYRLLGKEPDEALQPGDEVFNLRGDGKWEPSFNVETGYGQNFCTWYRRRIEQPKPEPKFAVGQRVRIVGPKERPAANWEAQMDRHIGTVGAVRLRPNETDEGIFCCVGDIGCWQFREDHLEPVEPKHYTLQVGDTISTPSGRQAIITELGIEVQ